MDNNDDNSNENVTNDFNSISSVENYKATIDLGSIEIFANYIEIVCNYITYFRNTANVMKNVEYYKYVLLKGINTICHVFKILLLYSKNVDLVIHHCEKSFFYYIEFIRQIDEEGHDLLKLNSTDASYFVFKKTIYEINDDYRKKFTQPEEKTEVNSDKMKITRLNKMIDIYNRLLVMVVHSTILDDKKTNGDGLPNQMVLVKNKMNNISDIFLQYLKGENETEDRFFELLNVIETFVFNYKNECVCIVPYIDVLFKKIKKRVGGDTNNKKKLINSCQILDNISKNIQKALFKINCLEENRCINKLNPSKYINLLIK